MVAQQAENEVEKKNLLPSWKLKVLCPTTIDILERQKYRLVLAIYNNSLLLAVNISRLQMVSTIDWWWFIRNN